MKTINKDWFTNKQGDKRNSSVKDFGVFLDIKSNELKEKGYASYRVYRVESPKEAGEITVVFAVNKESTDFRAFTIQPNGLVSGWWNWSNCQI